MTTDTAIGHTETTDTETTDTETTVTTATDIATTDTRKREIATANTQSTKDHKKTTATYRRVTNLLRPNSTTKRHHFSLPATSATRLPQT